MKSIFALGCLAGILLTSQAHAQARPTRMLAETGVCTKFIANGRDLTRGCQPKVVNTEFSNGRNSFTYFVGEDFVISFSGDARRQTHEGDDVAVMQIDALVSTLAGHTAPTERGVGSCRFSNPFKGQVAIIDCVLNLNSGGSAEARFRSDGRAPSVTPIR